MNGYEEAFTIEKLIGKLSEKNPISDPNNAIEWLKYTRTLSTTLLLLEENAKNTIDAQTESIGKQKDIQWKQRQKQK